MELITAPRRGSARGARGGGTLKVAPSTPYDAGGAASTHPTLPAVNASPDLVTVDALTLGDADDASSQGSSRQGITVADPWTFAADARSMASMAAPVAVSNLLEMSLYSVNLLYVGHIGGGSGHTATAMAAVVLASTFVNASGNALMFGLSQAIDTLASQAYGAGNMRLVGTIAQRAALILTIMCALVITLWQNCEPLLRLLDQPEDVTRAAVGYVKLLCVGVWGVNMFEVIKRWLASQGITQPPMYTALAGLVVQCSLLYLFVFALEMGLLGAALATSLTQLSLLVMLATHVSCKGMHKHTWPGWRNRGALQHWGVFLRVGVPSAFMMMLEWASFEVTTVFVGWTGVVPMAVHSVLSTTAGVLYMIPLGVSVAVGVLVGQHLGEGDPQRARAAWRASLCMGVAIVLGNVVMLTAGKDVWPQAFSDDGEVNEAASAMMPRFALYAAVDTLNCVAGGTMRGLGHQKLGAVFNMLTITGVGLPLAWYLGDRLGWSIQGVWWGLTAGVGLSAAVVVTYVTCFVDWEAASVVARERALADRVPVSGDADEDGGASVGGVMGGDVLGRGDMVPVAVVGRRAGGYARVEVADGDPDV